MKKLVTGLMMSAIATGALVAVAPAAQAAPYANLKDCKAAAARANQADDDAGQMANRNRVVCKRDGNGWRLGR
ncbi:hypothetical protein ACWF9G_22650 [Nocardia sp. NPDC055029]